MSNCTLHCIAATQEFIQATAAFLSALNITGCSSIVGKITLVDQVRFGISNNFIQGSALLDGGSGSFTGNTLFSSLTVQGVMDATVVAGNALAGSSTYSNTATGNIAAYGNTTLVGTVNDGLISQMGNGYLQLSDAAFAIKRFTGTLDGSGNLTLAHDITSGNYRITKALLYYKGGSGEMKELTLSHINATDIVATGGAASAPYRISIEYTSDSVVW